MIPPQETTLGDDAGELAVVGWGGTFGPLHMAVKRARAAGKRVSHIHLRHLWPLPPNLGALLDNFDRVVVAELNSGQLQTLLQSQLARPIASFTKVSGRPFRIAEILEAILTNLDSKQGVAA